MTAFTRAAGAALLLSAVALAQTAATRLTAVRFWSLGDVTRVAIELDGEASYHSNRVNNPDRIFFDFPGVKTPQRGLETIPVGDRLLKQVRIALWHTDMARVVLDLAGPVEYSVSELTNPDRLIVELRIAGKKTATPPVRSVTGSQSVPEPEEAPVSPALAPARPSVSPESRPGLARAEIPRAPGTGERPTVATRTATPNPSQTPAPRKVLAVLPPPPHPRPTQHAEMEPPPDTVNTAPASTLPSALHAIGTATLDSPDARTMPVSTISSPSLTRTAVVTLDKPEQKPESKPQSEVALAAALDSHGDRSLIRVLGLKLDRVVIDPGHGGHDTGTIGPGGLMEKDLVLDVSQRLGALITQRLRSEVVYTRTDDTFIPLQERTRIANEKKADLFLSIHANSSPLPAVSGSETYYLNFTTSRSALELAARENSTSETSIYDLQTLVQKIALKEKVQESREFAAAVQSALYSGVTRNKTVKNRGVKKAPFVVLIGANMPSVLAEIAFLSNPKEEKLLKKPEYRQRIAEALFKGVSQYANTLSHFQVAQHQPRPDAVPRSAEAEPASANR